MKVVILFTFLILITIATDWSGVDAIIQEAINKRAFPGGVLSVGNQKQILYTKAYGTLTYKQNIYQQPVLTSTLYDIASVTKVLGTTAAIMTLVQNNQLKVTDLVSKYIPEYDTNQKRNTTIANLLMHSSGLLYDYPGPLPATVDDVYNYIYLCKPSFPVGTKFSYSNLGFVVLAKIVQIITKRNITDYYHQNEVLIGLKTTHFNPKQQQFYNIAPTEFDTELRHKIVRGEAHERLTYFLGGAAGHSGYFSTASDLLQYVRILGGYGKLSTGSRVFTEEVVKTFTTKVNVDYQSSMAYGFDTGCPGTIMKDCFGHHGSTGCSAWTDRATNISFGFVTNRGHPNVNNNLFWDYIPHIADQIMKALGHTS